VDDLKPPKCMCGCGRETPLARYNDKRFGHVKGEHLRYCIGHAGGAGRLGDVDEGCKYIPTPEEIARECARIRAGWTAATLRHRAEEPPAWEPPLASRRTGLDLR